MAYCVTAFYVPPRDTHTVYDVTFHDHTIKTLVTNKPASVDTWISKLQTPLHSYDCTTLMGLDVEWRPNQSPNEEHPVATLQLCFGHRCLIFQILRATSIPQSLFNYLSDPLYMFAGVGIENDVEKLRRSYNLVVARKVDLRNVAADKYGEAELKNAGLKQLAGRVLGKDVNKPMSVTMSRWDDEVLSTEQVNYASIDAFLSFEIARHMMSSRP